MMTDADVDYALRRRPGRFDRDLDRDDDQGRYYDGLDEEDA